MKKRYFLLALMLSITLSIFADKVQIDGLWYNLSGTTAEVIESQDDNKYSGDIIIPCAVMYDDICYAVRSIGFSAFAGCQSLTSVTIPNSIVTIKGGAFTATSLTSITIPNSVETIENGAFRAAPLNTVIIGNNVKNIGRDAFDLCFNLRDLYCYAEEVPYSNDYGTPCTILFGDYSFEQVTLHVPAVSLNAYKTTEPWCNFKTIVSDIVPEGIEVKKENLWYELFPDKNEATVIRQKDDVPYSEEIVIPDYVEYNKSY